MAFKIHATYKSFIKHFMSISLTLKVCLLNIFATCHLKFVKLWFLALKFKYSEKPTKFSKISTLLFSVCTVDKIKVEIIQNFVAFSEYTNFILFAPTPIMIRSDCSTMPAKKHSPIFSLQVQFSCLLRCF